MNIMKKFIVFILCLLFAFMFNNDTFAAENVSVTYNNGTTYVDWQDVFPSCTTDCLNNYHYLLIENATFIPGFRFRSDGSSVLNQGQLLNYRAGKLIMELPYNGNSNNLLEFYGSNTFSSNVTFTLMESLPSNTPDCPPCIQDENSHYVQVVMDSFWNYHTAFAGSVVALIVIFLVYRLIKGRLR